MIKPSSPEPLGQFQPTWHKASLGEGTHGFTNKDHLIIKKEMIDFLLSKSIIAFKQMC